MSAKKIGLLLLLLGFGAVVETAWNLRGDVRIGPEGCRVIGGRFYGPSFAFEEKAEEALAPGETPRVTLRNAFGRVRVQAGQAGIVRVTLRKVVYLSPEDKARALSDQVHLLLTRDDDQVRIATNREEVARSEDVGLETHLDVEVPPDAVVDVRNDHGRVELTGVGAGDVDTSFDDVAVERVAGRLKVDTRQGGVSVNDVGGDLQVTARHGDVDVTAARGAGRFDVEHGNVTVRRAAAVEVALRYGDLTAETLGGGLVARASHAGVTADDVEGHVDLETSYGDVRLARVSNGARARVEHGRVEIADVTGPVQVETTHNDVELDLIDGAVTVAVQRGGVSGRGLSKGASVRSSGGDVTLDGFAGPTDVEADRGSVILRPRAALSAPLTASAPGGSVDVEIPEGSHVDVDAESRRGEIRADVPGLEREVRGEVGRGESLTGRVDGGGSMVRLRSAGDIRLEGKPAAPIADRAVARPAPPAPVAAEAEKAATPSPRAPARATDRDRESPERP